MKLITIFLISNACNLVFAGPASASTAAAGPVTTVVVSRSLGRVFFSQNNSRSSMPGCATNSAWVFDYTTVQGSAQLSQILTAYATGKPLFISGTNNCPDTTGYESVDFATLP